MTMETSNYTIIEEELICSNVQTILKIFQIPNYFSDRIGVEVSLQNGRVCGSNLNFYKTKSSGLGNFNFIVPPLSEPDKERIKNSTLGILRTLNVAIPSDLFGHIEVIAEFDPDRKMRIKNVSVNLKSYFKLMASC
jgi:hypothetical protein